MKICVISTPIFRVCSPNGTLGYSGLEVIAYFTAKGLASLGHQVVLVAPEGSECPNVGILSIGPERSCNERQAWDHYTDQLPEFDAIIDHSWSKFAYLSKMERGLKVPVLGVIHAPVNTMYGSLPPIEKPCFVCISQDQENHFEALHGRPARVCYNGIDLAYYRSLGVPRSDRFLFLARFSTIKGADIAIEACKEAGVGLDLIGDTTITNEPEYLAKCQAMADGKQIRIIGGVSRGETVWWYSQARGMVHLCPNFREPFGLAPVEAMACGCPVLCWDYGAMRETVQNWKTGLLVTHKQEAISMLRSGAVDTIDRNECVENAKRFSLERMVKRYEELCTEAVNGGW